MSTEFYVNLNDFSVWDRESIPPELVATARDCRLQVGTCFGNGDRKRTLVNLVQEKYGEWPEGYFSNHESASIEELRSSEKPYYSKWSRDSPIEFFDTELRFCWYIPTELQEHAEETESTEDYQKRMLDYWDSLLSDTTPIHHGSAYPINTWKDLKDTIFGDNRYMEPSGFTQGTFIVENRELFSIEDEVPLEFRVALGVENETDTLKTIYNVFCYIAKKFQENQRETVYSVTNPPGEMVSILEEMGLLQSNRSDTEFGTSAGPINVKPTERGAELYKICISE